MRAVSIVWCMDRQTLFNKLGERKHRYHPRPGNARNSSQGGRGKTWGVVISEGSGGGGLLLALQDDCYLGRPLGG